QFVAELVAELAQSSGVYRARQTRTHRRRKKKASRKGAKKSKEMKKVGKRTTQDAADVRRGGRSAEALRAHSFLVDTASCRPDLAPCRLWALAPLREAYAALRRVRTDHGASATVPSATKGFTITSGAGRAAR